MGDIEVTTSSDSGFATESIVGEFALGIDPNEEAGPNPNAVLVADYAACFLPAIRAGAQRAGLDDLGKIEIESEADIDDNQDIDAIRFTVYVEAEIDDVEDLIGRAEQICHVHTALREELHADVTVEDGAF
jgi:organic hydroperoxide reductase OsmC/OhrA